MDILLKFLVPGNIKNFNPQSELWGRELVFPGSTRIRITAPSAGGKTTFVRMLYGLNSDFTGGIHYANMNTRDYSAKQWAFYRQQILSVVFQELRLFADFSGLDNILVKSYLTMVCSREKISAMAERLGMGKALEKKVKCMSLGERQRIAILRSLVQPFRWLILDEPFSHLDADNCSQALKLILGECAANRAGIIFTSHGDDSAFPADKVLRI